MSQINVNNIKNRAGTGAPTLGNGVVVTGVVTATTGAFSGNVSIGGTLTYEDVTNIDSVGIITARSDVSIADKIVHTGDTDTAIRFPSDNVFTVETAGGEAIRVDAGRRLLVGTDSSANYGGDTGILQINGTTNASMALKRSTDNATEPTFVFAKSRGTAASPTKVNGSDVLGAIRFSGYDGSDYVSQAASILCAADNATGSDDMPGRLVFNTTADGAATPSERVRINSSGDVIVNGTVTGSNAKFEVRSTTGSIYSATARLNGDVTDTGAINTGSSLLFAGHDGGNASRDFASIFAGKENGTSGNYNAYLSFGTRSNGSPLAERLRITSTGGVHFNNAELIERANIVANKLSAAPTINLDNGMIHHFTTTETTTATPNITSTAGINTNMAIGDAMSVTIVTTAAAAGYAATVTIDHLNAGNNGGSLNWTGGSAPSDGGASGVDIYAYTLIKTADAKFTVIATQTKTS